ncbi:MAG: ATP-dependent Clp protease adaptor ClpS [Verrucomicrobiota bacterium]
MSAAVPATIEKKKPKSSQHYPSWGVIVWNDPINLMSYVVRVFKVVLGFDPAKAKKHMLEVHEKGKSCVAKETKEKAEFYWQQLQVRGLKVTIEKLN